MTETTTTTSTETSDAPATETKGAPEATGTQAEAASAAKAEGGGEKPGKASTGKADPAADPAKDAAPEAEKSAQDKAEAEKPDERKTIRDHLAKHGLPPASIEEYGFKPSEKTAAWFVDGEKDPLAKAALEVAHKHGLGKMQASPFINDLIEQVAEKLDLEPPIDIEAERMKLLPRDAIGLSKTAQEQAIDARYEEVHAFMNTLEQNGLAADSVNALVTILDTAAGVQAIEFLKSQMRGDGLATGGNASAAAELASLEAEQASERYRNDPNYRVSVQNRILKAKGMA